MELQSQTGLRDGKEKNTKIFHGRHGRISDIPFSKDGWFIIKKKKKNTHLFII